MEDEDLGDRDHGAGGAFLRGGGRGEGVRDTLEDPFPLTVPSLTMTLPWLSLHCHHHRRLLECLLCVRHGLGSGDMWSPLPGGGGPRDMSTQVKMSLGKGALCKGDRGWA